MLPMRRGARLLKVSAPQRGPRGGPQEQARMDYAMNELWRPIPLFSDYEVSNHGNVRSRKPLRNFAPIPTEPRKIRPGTDKDGYKRIVCYGNGLRKEWRVHVLVCLVWKGQPPEGKPLALHRDGNNTNNRSDNLYWGSAAENSADSKRHGVWVHGSRVNTSRLSEEQVVEIIKSRESATSLAERFHVTIGTIYHIKRGVTWRHVERTK